MKVRVLFIVNTDEYGGMEKHVLEVVMGLDPSMIASTILCYGPDFYSPRLRQRPDIRIIVARATTSKSFFSYWRDFIRLKPDVIVFEKGWMECYPLKAYLAARLGRARKVVTVEHLLAEPMPPKSTARGLRGFLHLFLG